MTDSSDKILNVNTSQALGENPLQTSLETGNANKGQVEVEFQTIIGVSEQNRQLRSIGKSIAPDGYEYEGSIAIHLYKRANLAGDYALETRTQTCLDCQSPRAVSLAIKAASIAVAQKYGWQPEKRQASHVKGS